jgi:calcineurin-like phosphoesterase family protein
MANVFFIADLHFGHKNICKYRPFETELEHREWLMDNWQSVVSKRDKVFVLGDCCFSKEAIGSLSGLNGHKSLVIGNHCTERLNIRDIIEAFTNVSGLVKYKEFWLSHAPIHPAELRDKINVHGHVHDKAIDDDRYVNVCVESINGTPIDLNKLRSLAH